MSGRAAPGSAASHRARATLMAVFDPQNTEENGDCESIRSPRNLRFPI